MMRYNSPKRGSNKKSRSRRFKTLSYHLQHLQPYDGTNYNIDVTVNSVLTPYKEEIEVHSHSLSSTNKRDHSESSSSIQMEIPSSNSSRP